MTVSTCLAWTCRRAGRHLLLWSHFLSAILSVDHVLVANLAILVFPDVDGCVKLSSFMNIHTPLVFRREPRNYNRRLQSHREIIRRSLSWSREEGSDWTLIAIMSSALVSLGVTSHSWMPTSALSHTKHKRSRSMPASTTHLFLGDFHNQLGAKVEIILMQQQVQQPESYNFSAFWLGQVLDVVLFIYSNLKDLYPRMQIENNLDGN